MKPTLSKYQNRHIEYVKNKVAKALMDYHLVSKGDKILAAVSGGKDSLVMLEALAAVLKFDFMDFKMEALHIDVKDVPYAVNKNFLKDFCKKLDVKINFVSLEAGIEERGKKSPCFVCSWSRRKALFNFTKDNGFQKLALGHHLDDAVETLLINMAYHGNIASMPAKLSMFDDSFQLIRPLILLTNKDTSEFANIRKYPPLIQACPFEDTTKRTTARELIQQLENIHPKARLNLFKSMGNIDEEYLP